MISAHSLNAVLALLNARKSKILTIAQVAMSEHQFKAYRSLVLDELGKEGLESELAILLNEGNHPVKHRHGQE
ncbi:BTB_POZ_BACH1 domain containing protein [Methylophilaceae bacterium]